MSSNLYIVSTPIGNIDDITIRALNTLKEVDFIICEEYKPARRFLSQLDLSNKELISVNEHNEKESTQEILNMILEGKSAALISDCGTPLFSDPGHHLLDMALSYKIDVKIIPGVSSILPAMTGSNLHIEKFFYFGWLSPKKEIRRQELFHLKKVKEVIVLMETPYRLKKILADVLNTFGKLTQIVLAYELTSSNEVFFRGPVYEILAVAEKKNLKGEFVLIIDNRK